MRAAVEPCTALINECNAASVVSIEACLGAYIVCNYGEQIPYQLSGYNPYDMRIKCEKLPLCYDFDNVDKYLNRYVGKRYRLNLLSFSIRADVKETLGANGGWSSCNMLANKLYIADYMKHYHLEIADLLNNGLDVTSLVLLTL